MGKANWFFNTRERRWEMRDAAGVMIMTGNNAGVAMPRVTVGSLAIDRGLVVQTTGTIQNLNVGSLGILQTVVVSAQGTIRDLRVPSLASLQAVNINAQGSVQNLNVGTLATLRDLVVANVGSFNALQGQTIQIRGGNALARWEILTGTIPGITSIGTGAVAIATITGMGSQGIGLNDLFFGRVDAAGMGGHTGIVGYYIPTTNVINALIVNSKPDSAGSFVAVGWRGLFTGV